MAKTIKDLLNELGTIQAEIDTVSHEETNKSIGEVMAKLLKLNNILETIKHMQEREKEFVKSFNPEEDEEEDELKAIGRIDAINYLFEQIKKI